MRTSAPLPLVLAFLCSVVHGWHMIHSVESHATLESVGRNAVRIYNAQREHKGYNGEGDAEHIHHKPVHSLVYIETFSGSGKVVSNYMNLTEWDIIVAAGLTRSYRTITTVISPVILSMPCFAPLLQLPTRS